MRDHLQDLTVALSSLLHAIERHEDDNENERNESVPSIELIPYDEFDNWLHRGGGLIDDPIGYSLRLGIRKIGEIVVRMYSVKELHTILDNAVGPEAFPFKIDIVDKNWDGLQDKTGSVWVA